METREQMVAWTDVWTDPTLVFSEAGDLLHTNAAALRVFSDSEREEAVDVWNHIQTHPEHHPFPWSNSAGSAAYTVHPGQVDGCYFAVFKDAREHGELVAALNHNKLLYSGLANGTIEGLALVNEGKVIDSNPQLWRVIGVSNAVELAEINLETLLGVRNWKRLAVRQGEVLEFEFVNLLGKQLVVEGRMSQVGEDSESFALALLDITEKRKISQDLLQTKERFRLLVETNPFGLFLVVQGNIRYTNQAGMEILAIQDEEEVYNQRLTNFFEDGDQVRITEDMDRILSGEKTTYLEVSILQANGKVREVGVQMVLSFFDNQPAVQVTVNDLSTRMQLVREQMRRSSAEEANSLLKEEINQHRKTQKQLMRAERFNRSIIESSIDMIMAFDAEGNIIQFNHAASVEFGMTAEDAMQLKGHDFLENPADFETILKDLRKQRYYAGEVAGRRASEEVFQMLISIAALQNEEGEETGFVLVGRDITDIRLAEQELRRSEERYRDILDNASDLVFLMDEEGRITYANPAFFSTLGYDAKSLKTIKIQEIASPPEGQRIEDWKHWLVGNSNELTFKGKDGSELRMLGGGSVQTNPKGQLIGLRCIYLNVSEVRAYQRSALVQSAKLESIFNSTRYLLMFTIDQKFNVTSVNQNIVEVLNEQFGFETIVGTPILELLKEVVSEEFYRGQFQLFVRAAQGVQQQFELPLVTQQGEVVWYQLFVNPVQYDEGTKELSCIAYDITERKEIDNQIRAALEEKEILLQEVHHRVKNNLQVISSMLNLQRRFVDDAKMLEVLDESQNRISTMSFIHESLYKNSDFSSIGFSDYLERLTQNLIHSYSNLTTGVELITKLDDVHINLKQAIPCGLIVNELVSNCLKYAFKGMSSGKIYLRVQRVGVNLEIQVADNGVGLPEDFDFETNESLGVYLVQALTDQLDGSLIVDNKHSDNALEWTTGASFLVSFTPLTD
jgi:PAS domain S-box-containing protein